MYTDSHNSFTATTPHGRQVEVSFDASGITLARIKLPWSHIHMIECPDPGVVEITTIAKTGDHVKVLLKEAHVPVTEELIASLAKKESHED